MFPNVCITTTENELVLRESSHHQRVHHTAGAALLSHTEHTCKRMWQLELILVSAETLCRYLRATEMKTHEQKTELTLWETRTWLGLITDVLPVGRSRYSGGAAGSKHSPTLTRSVPLKCYSNHMFLPHVMGLKKRKRSTLCCLCCINAWQIFAYTHTYIHIRMHGVWSPVCWGSVWGFSYPEIPQNKPCEDGMSLLCEIK